MQAQVRAALALIPAIALVAVIFYLLIFSDLEKSYDVLLILIGALVAMAEKGSGYFMGSSQGSADKTAALIERDQEHGPK